jgi:alkylated DNA repair dioxygenase AlkB
MDTQASLFDVVPGGSATRDEGTIFEGHLPRGLTLLLHFLSGLEEEEILAEIDKDGDPWIGELRRRVKHFGYRYNYKARALSLSDRIGDLPDWASAIGERLLENGYFSRQPDQVIVNEYLPGQGIASHVDRNSCFGAEVASVSLGSATVMDFRDDLRGESGRVLLPERSAVVLHDEARYAWSHGIAARKIDSIAGKTYARRRRVSLTFRTVLLDV